jgi:PAS domain S-box-containing protein
MTCPSPDPGWPPGQSETARLLRQTDWAATGLGPSERWPERLKVVVEMMLASPLVSSLACGPERVLLYNDAAARLYGERHPEVLGHALAEGFPESYPVVAAFYDRAFAGETVQVQAQPVDVSNAGGEVFESYLTPVRGGDGGIVAVQMIGFEVGARLAAEDALRKGQARQAFLLRLSDGLRGLSDPLDIQGESARLLREHFGAGWACHLEWDDGDAVGTVERDSTREGLPSMVGVHDISDAPEVAGLLRSGQVLNVPDLGTCPLSGLGVVRRLGSLGFRSVLGASLVSDGRLRATLLLADTAPRRWSREEATFLIDVAGLAWAAAERARAVSALRANEDRFRAIVETARDYAIFTTDAEGRIETWPAGAQEVFGWTAEEALGQSVDMTFTPEDRVRGEPRHERSQARMKGHAADVRWHQRKDGSRVFIEGSARPLGGPGGSVTGFVKVGQDVTDRRGTQEALRASEERFRQFGDASGDVLWIRDAAALTFEYVSPAFEEIFGSPLDHVLGRQQVRRWAELVLPKDREAALDGLRRVREGEHILLTFRIRRTDGEVRWIRDTSFPLLDDAGRVRRIAGIYHDATDEVELQDRLRELVAELQHRTRNLIGVVRGVAERTRATSGTLEEFQPRFLARLDALGRVNALLSRLREGDRVSLDQLLRTELEAHGIMDGDGRPVSLSGAPGLRLRSAPVQTFALVIHELAANAIEHGALSRQDGRIEVSWAVEGGADAERRLRLDWRETWAASEGVEAPVPPPRQGHGRQLIERALPYQLGARTIYELGPDGLTCTILAPAALTLDEPFPKSGGGLEG